MGPASQALLDSQLRLLDSQNGPFAATAYTLLPTTSALVIESAHFRVFRCGVSGGPHTRAKCTRNRLLDPRGDHRAACPRSGALRARGVALERAMPHICRGAGASVSTHVLFPDVNTTSYLTDERRVEVIINGFPPRGMGRSWPSTTLVPPPSSPSAWPALRTPLFMRIRVRMRMRILIF